MDFFYLLSLSLSLSVSLPLDPTIIPEMTNEREEALLCSVLSRLLHYHNIRLSLSPSLSVLYKTVDTQERTQLLLLFCFPMLSSAEEQNSHRVLLSDSNKNKSLDRVSSSTSSPSSSTSSSSLPISQAQFKPQPAMEEVWKDINLASIHHHGQIPHDPRVRTQHPNSILQDFLNRPQSHDPPPTRLSMGSSSNGDTSTVTALYGSPLPPPATVLSLNSSAGFEFLDNPDPHLQNHPHLSSNISSLTTPFEALASAGQFGFYGKKRGQDSDSSSDRRHKRMIKNRESAARSRARKQAYTNELELEIANLQAENARLKGEQEQQRMAAASQLPKKNTLQRTSTAPF
ncbi:PREDICTED: protein FD-like isoform X2 [Tarenaya hassleriana]|uniref:protein FD-like isoform X2 n=1 Tax=Tarenaya hassleriana TaxID=28532 RepID=UPI00053C696F|nr:PREDICTED: protein FD-like isoform X2 [Tarenaya hassleriana]